MESSLLARRSFPPPAPRSTGGGTLCFSRRWPTRSATVPNDPSLHTYLQLQNPPVCRQPSALDSMAAILVLRPESAIATRHCSVQLAIALYVRTQTRQ